MKNNRQPVSFDEGIFKQLCLDFISYKRSCGLKYCDSAEYVLRFINRNLNEYDLSAPVLTKEMVERLTEKRLHEQFSTQSRRITLLRQFAIYLSYRGIDAYVYPGMSIHNEETTFVPYIFTNAEIEAIFNVADNLRPISRYPHYHLVYPVLIRLLYSCGLRLSEALNLRLKDINLDEGTLYIDKSKNSKSRVVPMSPSMTEVCRRYIDKRYGYVALERYLFEAPDGNRYNRGSVRFVIISIFKKAGLPRLANGLYPRVHDLRHNYAVQALEKMQKSGMDIYCALPLISAYLGHKGIRETERYLHLPEFRLEEISVSNKNLVRGMIPEVEWNEET
jgi:integrase